MKKYFNNYKEYSFVSNYLMVLLKILLCYLSKSLIFLISSVYSLNVGFTKQNIYSRKPKSRIKVGLSILGASIAYIVYSIYIIYHHKLFTYDLYTGLLIATVNFFDLGFSIYGVIKYYKLKDENNLLYKYTNLVTSLISLDLTQIALLSFTQQGVDNSLYNGLFGILIGIITSIISIKILFINKKITK